MNKYIIAYVSLFENQLTQTLVEATSERDAMLKYLAAKQDIVFDEQELLGLEDVASLVEKCFDMDSNISVYKLD